MEIITYYSVCKGRRTPRHRLVLAQTFAAQTVGVASSPPIDYCGMRFDSLQTGGATWVLWTTFVASEPLLRGSSIFSAKTETGFGEIQMRLDGTAPSSIIKEAQREWPRVVLL